MKLKHSTFIIVLLSTGLQAQKTAADSLQLVSVLKELVTLCRNVDFSDPKTTQLGTFYKVAPMIVYRGEDMSRKWKDIADYNKAEDKKGVDEICYKINSTINQDTAYKIISYQVQKESEGVWNALQIRYLRKGTYKKILFAFLNVKGKWVLGDIDSGS